MATTYTTGDDKLYDLLDEVMRLYHPKLAEATVQVNCLFAWSDKDDVQALRKNGYPALALIKINSLQDRIEGKKDATLKLDGDHWKDLPDPQRRALLDHELSHLVVVEDADGKPKTDDIGRPKLKPRPHDVEIGLFADVVERHKNQALEAQAVHSAWTKFVQGVFHWG